ncbi:helix-turn-helix domain-containing protein [Actinoplanes bogorensis]|uniref:Helix-turn-helix domain-containing protein n=1 Tax=Paractinoplanes bogorensis TaxID=1610840 RepID=A0ABS5YU84_9ACTN|nr:helix-turn-helix transcriptional regulator [Actinoplanes bogorensis]MBU2666621.1 helix-turn-helix domain-containing protein [Actinoplanes bogorensis]
MVVDEYVQGRPAAALAPFVAHYSGYRQAGVAPTRHLGLPSPWLTMILTLNDPLVMESHPDPRQSPGRYDALLGGLHLRPAVIVHDGWQSGVQVALRPLGCRALFGLPAGELAGLDVDAADVLGRRSVAEVREKIAAAEGWAARFTMVDEWLAGHLSDGASGRMTYAWDLVLKGVPIRTVADRVGWSGHHLTDRFRAETGLRPKEAARVARFDRARRALRPGRAIAAVAAEHGFADQSHLVREFRALAGCSPSEWLAGQFDFVQAQPIGEAHDEGHD